MIVLRIFGILVILAGIVSSVKPEMMWEFTNRGKGKKPTDEDLINVRGKVNFMLSFGLAAIVLSFMIK